MHTVLIIDDDPDICTLLQQFLKRHDYDPDTAFSLKKGLAQFKEKEHDVVLCDYRLPDGEGLEMIQTIKSIHPSSNIIIMTGYSDVKLAVKCIKQGASDYVNKPIQPEEILHAIEVAAVKKQDESRPSAGRGKRKPIPKRTSSIPKKQFVKGVSPQSKQVLKLIDLVAPTDMSVIVEGETGTGKEYVARRIHEHSERADGPFIAIDCGALPKDIAGSELFGHKKGSFTGALNDKVGAFEAADGGTIFLDEIANLDYANQVKLLRVLQERTIRRIGETKERSVDVRILVASNEDLWEKSQEGDFREDLFHRLNEFSLRLAPLRERTIEIEQFANHFVERANRELNKNIKGISKSGMEVLMQHEWHGNLREMRNAIKRAVLLAESDRLKPVDFPVDLSRRKAKENGAGVAFSGNYNSLKEAAESAERQMIMRTLERTAYNKSKTADLLKVDRKTLYNKIKAYDIDLKK